MSWCCFKPGSGSKEFDLASASASAQTRAQAQEVVPSQARFGDASSVESSFFVITAIFNPASFKSRYDLYHKFARHMEECGAQLITIECIFPILNQNEFQVTNAQNPNHIQLKSRSVYWVKEQLINIAASRLPAHAKYVCWLDADIQFHDPDWIEKTILQLREFSIVQIFEKANFLGPANEVLRNDYSFGYSVVHGKPIDQNRYDEWYPHSGYGWATSVKAFRHIGGLPDYDILGSGDLHFAFSLLDRVTNALESDLNPKFKNLIVQQSAQTYNKLSQLSKSESKAMIGYVPLTISHNWHGSRKHRQYVNRWKILIAHNFDHSSDTKKTTDGLLELIHGHRSEEGRPSLQEDIIAYFAMRNEDDIEYEAEDNSVTAHKTKKKKKRKFPRSGVKSKDFVGDLGLDSDPKLESGGYHSNDSGGAEISDSDSDDDSNEQGGDGGSNREDDRPDKGDSGTGAVAGYVQDYGGTIETTTQY